MVKKVDGFHEVITENIWNCFVGNFALAKSSNVFSVQVSMQILIRAYITNKGSFSS